LIAFLVITLLAAWAAWLVWSASMLGGILTVVLLPVEAWFWIGFDLPIPKAIAWSGRPPHRRLDIARLTRSVLGASARSGARAA
jgi:hypothetical protein